MSTIKTLYHHPQRKLLVLGFIFVLLVLMSFSLRFWSYFKLKQQTQEELLPIVFLIKAQLAPSDSEMIIPGNVQAWHEASIYARINGYIKHWYVDIGSHVEKGQLLAKIETPELDAQLRQAEANLRVSMAQNKLAQTTATRWKKLLKTDSVSQQSTDEKVDTAEALSANVQANRAQRDHLSEMVGFERIIAPFKGIISDRRTDIGALINIGSSPNESHALFRIVQIDPLRIYVQIPEAYVSRLKNHMDVQLQFIEHPGLRFPAKLLETAHAIDPATRTLLSQFIVNNPKGILLPGSYTQVHFIMPNFANTVRIPVNALIFRKEGLQIATVNKAQRVCLKNIVVYHDFGTEVEVASGIAPGEKLIINPSDAIYSGQAVRPQPFTS